MIEMSSKVGLKGYFKIEAHQQDADGNVLPGSERVVADWFPNMIVDSGLELLKDNPGRFLAYCRVGSSATPVQPSDSRLGAQVASAYSDPSTKNGPSSSVSPRYSSVTHTYSFDQGAAAGNLSEIGVGPSSAGDLLARALIVDANGDPTTITVLPIEFLTVTYNFRVYWDESTTTSTFTVDGVEYTATCMPGHFNASAAWVSNYGGWISGQGEGDGVYTSASAVGTPFSGLPASSGTRSTSYTATKGPLGSYYVDRTWTFSISQGNATGGIKTMYVSKDSPRHWTQYKVGFDPVLPKDNTKTMSVSFRFSWERYEP